MGEVLQMTPDVPDPLRAAQENELRTLEIMVERMQLRRMSLTFGGKRDMYEVLGYSPQLSIADYRERYARGGVAGRVVDALPKATWRGGLELIENEKKSTQTVFEKQWTDFEKRLSVTSVLLRADILSRLSTFSVLLLGNVGGDPDLSHELPRGNGTPDAIKYLAPYCGGGNALSSRNIAGAVTTTIDLADARIAEWDTDTSSPRYAQPKFYSLRRTSFTELNNVRLVHWSRVIHLAEGCLDDDVYGEPALQRCWNLFDDLEKVTGGGAEAYWMRANQGLLLNLDKDVKTLTAPEKTEFANEIERYQHRMSRIMRLRGVKATPLGSDVADIGNPADAILTQIAGTTTIPKRVLTGSEMGELASTQDRENWADQVSGRRESYAGPFVVRRLIQRLIEFNHFAAPAESFDMRWGTVKHLTELEKAQGAKLWSETKDLAGDPVFTEDEIRDHWYGKDPVEEEEDAEQWRADLALKMAQINKTQGAVIITDDEIRMICYGKEPLTPEQKIPITAPERVSATAPTPTADAQGNPIAAKPPQIRAAEDGDIDIALVERLAEAIENRDTETIHAILGVR